MSSARTAGGGTRGARPGKRSPQICLQAGVVAVGGGQVVFDLFLMIGFDGFHLSRAHGVELPGGRSVFSACDQGVTAASVLEQHRLTLSKTMPLDPEHNVEMTIWRRARELDRRPAAVLCLRAGRACIRARLAQYGREERS